MAKGQRYNSPRNDRQSKYTHARERARHTATHSKEAARCCPVARRVDEKLTRNRSR